MTDHHHDPVWDDETAEWYAEEYGDHFSTTLAVELSDLQLTDIVLDIGCGSGNSCRAAASVVTKGGVIGIDPTPAMIRIAREQSEDHPNGDRIQFMGGSAEEIPLDDASVTVAMAVNTLHHWDDIDAGLAEVKRVLRRGGRFILADELIEDGTTHGEGVLSDPVQIEVLLGKAGFQQVSRSDHAHVDEGMCFFSAVRP